MAINADIPMVREQAVNIRLLNKAETYQKEVVAAQSALSVSGMRLRESYLGENNPISVRLNREVTRASVVGAVATSAITSLVVAAAPYAAPSVPWIAASVQWVGRLSTLQKMLGATGIITAGAAAGATGTYVFKLTTLRTSELFIRFMQESRMNQFEKDMKKQAFSIQTLTDKADRTLVCPITLGFPRIPVTINGQSYEMATLRTWIENNPEGINSPRRDGHITKEQVEEYDLTYFSRWSQEMTRLRTSKPDWLSAEISKFIEHETKVNHVEQNVVADHLTLAITKEFESGHINGDELRAYLLIVKTFRSGEPEVSPFRPVTFGMRGMWDRLFG